MSGGADDHYLKKDDKPYYDFDHYAIGFGAWLDDAVKQFENSVEGSLSVKYSKGREYYYQRIRSKDGKLIFKRLHLDNEEEALLGLKLFEKAKYRKKIWNKSAMTQGWPAESQRFEYRQ